MNLEPLTREERDAHRCAMCNKHLAARRIVSVRDIANFRPNRRVIKVKQIAHGDEWWITYLPDDARGWGYDGVFCTLRCGARFARAAHRGGFRMVPP